MSRRSWTWFVVFCALSMFAACGGGGGEPTTDTGTPPKTCEGDSDCATNDPCKTGSCVEGECVEEIKLGDVCDDGDTCTEETTCQADGSCGGGTSANIESGPCEICECTEEGVSCTAKPVGTTCSDGDCCTGNDKCTSCDPDLEFCPDTAVYCQGTMTDCDDGNQCTVNACACVEGTATCGSLANEDGTACDIDDNDCTQQDTCQSGQCEVGALLELSDGNECTFDYCDKGAVKHDAYLQSDQVSCNDGDLCTTADYCHLGSCVGSPLQCTIPPCANTAACNQDTGACDIEWTPVGGDCDDGNPCTASEICDALHNCSGGADTNCDDGKPCTTDYCDIETGDCVHDLFTGGCDDGLACSVSDQCQVDGSCAGTAVNCSVVSSPCLQTSCNPDSGACDLPMPDGTSCADTSLCNGDEVCAAGVCQTGEAVDCSGQDNPCYFAVCNPTTGACDYPTPDMTPCEDGNLCTTGDHCVIGSCLPGGVVYCDPQPCATSSVCDQDSGACDYTWLPVDSACDDGDTCSEETFCDEDNECVGPGQIDCDDGLPCTNDYCLDGECEHDLITGGCVDDDLCTINDVCQGDGTCQGEAIVCNNASLPCLQDTCNPDTGVCDIPVPEGSPCPDSLACNGDEVCYDGQCQPGVAVDCSGQDDPCFYALCNPDTGLCDAPRPTGTPCDDQDNCTTGENCLAGSCLPGSPVLCDGSNPCVIDQCNPDTGQCDIPVEDGTYCIDGNLCDGVETCQSGVCAEGSAVDCSGVDPDGCIAAVCNPETGSCDYPKQPGISCVDGDVCTINDVCNSLAICEGAPLQCNNSADPCLQSVCNPDTGSCDLAMPNGSPCGNQALCDGAETCQAGSCQSGTTVDCSQVPNECIQPVCNPSTGGCDLAKETGTACEDGNACTVDDSCSSGLCLPGADIVCPAEACASGSACDENQGCVYTWLPEGSVCDDSDPCTVETFCDGDNNCEGVVKCDDGNPCTTDSCNEITGACTFQFQPGTSCTDGSMCTMDDVCTGDPLDSSTWSCTGTAVDCSGVTNLCVEKTCNQETGQCNLAKPEGTTCGAVRGCQVQVCSSGNCAFQNRPTSIVLQGNVYALDQLPDGGLLVGTYKNSDIQVFRTNAMGSILWTRSFGGLDVESPTDIQYSATGADGGAIYVLGYTKTWGAGSEDVYLIQLDLDGNENWNHVEGDVASNRPLNLLLQPDGAVVFAYKSSGANVTISKVSKDGVPVEQETHSVGVATLESLAADGEVYADQCYSSGCQNYWIMNRGAEVWYTGTGSSGSYAQHHDDAVTFDIAPKYTSAYTHIFGSVGEPLMTGYTHKDLWVSRIHNNQEKIWEVTVPTPDGFGWVRPAVALYQPNYQDLLMLGTTRASDGIIMAAMIALDTDGNYTIPSSFGTVNRPFYSGTITGTSTPYGAAGGSSAGIIYFMEITGELCSGP